ncbi:helix-turn-helix transcriptional regulator [Streptomyces sp. NPDC046853]|uniref:helix-turn-helix domain-containing protein n=1 Tax=Streptomyces sp. NPDC046853 TaxID=3154920 RepID=UPI0033F69A64
MPRSDDPQNDRFYVAVGDRVRGARIASRLTQSDLAARLGLVRSSIANIEAGRQRVPLHTFVAIAAALKVEVAELIPDGSEVNSTPDLGDIDKQLVDADASSRDFVQSALAQLRSNPDSKE